jgi:hypothetical protein
MSVRFGGFVEWSRLLLSEQFEDLRLELNSGATEVEDIY